jgi:hypothetical protein
VARPASSVYVQERRSSADPIDRHELEVIDGWDDVSIKRIDRFKDGTSKATTLYRLRIPAKK